MNPQLLMAMLSGQGNSGASPSGQNPLQQMFGNSMGTMPLLFMLAGMGIPQLSKAIGSIANTFMDMQSAKEDTQGQNPGALPEQAESPMGPPAMGGPSPAPGGAPAGGPPPQVVQALMQLAAQRRMAQQAQGGMPPAPMPMAA